MTTQTNGRRALAVAATATATAILGAPTVRAEAAVDHFHACSESWQSPRSALAQQCRDDGWTVRGRAVVSPGHRLRHNTFAPCELEDSSFCYWDAAERGNGRGRSFIALRQRVVYYRVVRPQVVRPQVVRSQVVRSQRHRSGQKMTSPDLRRVRSSWSASSRMICASLSERRSFT